MDGWRILENFSASDRQYIAFEVVDPTCCLRNVAGVNIGKFVEALGAGGAALKGAPGGGSVAAHTVVNSVMNLITTTYEDSMHGGRQTFLDLRRQYHKLHRLTQRLHTIEEACASKELYRSARRRIRSAINKSKARGWQNLINEDHPENRGSVEALYTDQKDRIMRAFSPQTSCTGALFTMRELKEAVLAAKQVGAKP